MNRTDLSQGIRPKLLAALGVTLTLGSLGLLQACKPTQAQTAAPPPVEVSVMEAALRPVELFDEYVAQTQAPDTIEIRAQVTGLLERQAFADGARVRKDDLLYVIDPRPFQAQVAQAKANLAQAEANLINANQNLARNGRLIAERAVSQADYDAAVAQARASEALVEAQRAVLRNAEINLEFTTVRAPRAGFMSGSQLKPGALLSLRRSRRCSAPCIRATRCGSISRSAKPACSNYRRRNARPTRARRFVSRSPTAASTR